MSNGFLSDGSSFQAFLVPETVMKHESILAEDGTCLLQLNEETLRLFESSEHYDLVDDVFEKKNSYPLACVFYVNPRQDVSNFFDAQDVDSTLANLQGFTNSIVNDTVMFPERLSPLMAALSISLNSPILDPSDYILYNGYVDAPVLRMKRNLGLLGRAVFDLAPKFVLDGKKIEIFAHIYRDLRRAFSFDVPEVRRLKSSTEISLRSRDSEINNVDLSDIILLSAIDALDLDEELAKNINLPVDAFRQVRNSLAHGRRRNDEEMYLNLFTVWRNAFLIRLQEVNDRF